MANPGSFLVSNKVWDKYKNIVQKFMDMDSGLQEVTYLKHIINPLPFGEDDDSNNYIPIRIKGLINYNSFRTWPLNVGTPSGELDEINCALLLSKSHLLEMNLLNEEGYFEFDTTLDRFIINGESYISKGDTQVAQAKDEAIVFQILLRRQNDGNYTTNQTEGN